MTVPVEEEEEEEEEESLGGGGGGGGGLTACNECQKVGKHNALTAPCRVTPPLGARCDECTSVLFPCTSSCSHSHAHATASDTATLCFPNPHIVIGRTKQCHIIECHVSHHHTAQSPTLTL